MPQPRRENGKMLFVLLCVFFLVVFFSRYDIDIWLATVSLAELMKSPRASDWSTRAADWSNRIIYFFQFQYGTPCQRETRKELSFNMCEQET